MESKGSIQGERVYALDTLRSIMMLLRIVIHPGFTSSLSQPNFYPNQTVPGR
jgi:hypothetical protein